MIWLLFILLLLILVICYLLFAPFYLEVDNIKHMIRVRFHRIISARFIIEDNTAFIKVKFLGWQLKFDLLKPKNERKKEPHEKRMQSNKISTSKIIAVIGSFKINKFYVTLDTGNYALNARLIPVFYSLGYLINKTVTINFLQKNIFKLEIENNISRILWAYITY